MARRNNACQSQSRGRGPQYTSPAPLYDRVEDLLPAAPPAVPAVPVGSAARAALAETEIRICRYPSTLPTPASAAEQETLCLLRRQNELLTEILGALNAQLAVRLDQRSR